MTHSYKPQSCGSRCCRQCDHSQPAEHLTPYVPNSNDPPSGTSNTRLHMCTCTRTPIAIVVVVVLDVRLIIVVVIVVVLLVIIVVVVVLVVGF